MSNSQVLRKKKRATEQHGVLADIARSTEKVSKDRQTCSKQQKRAFCSTHTEPGEKQGMDKKGYKEEKYF